MVFNPVCEGPWHFNSLSFITPTPSHFLSLTLVFSVQINKKEFPVRRSTLHVEQTTYSKTDHLVSPTWVIGIRRGEELWLQSREDQELSTDNTGHELIFKIRSEDQTVDSRIIRISSWGTITTGSSCDFVTVCITGWQKLCGKSDKTSMVQMVLNRVPVLNTENSD